MHSAKNYSRLKGIEGFSDALLDAHFTLYKGYVENVNKLETALEKIGDSVTPEQAEMKRRFGWEYNGMRLHELYFENMTKEDSIVKADSTLIDKITTDFGSFPNWERNFRAVAGMRGIGWTMLVMDKTDLKLYNIWINEHDTGHLINTNPILVMDVFEHAYTLDYGVKKADYIDAFMKAIDWSVLESRFFPA